MKKVSLVLSWIWDLILFFSAEFAGRKLWEKFMVILFAIIFFSMFFLNWSGWVRYPIMYFCMAIPSFWLLFGRYLKNDDSEMERDSQE